ncbi:hypothetical protein [Taibaiella koreensis]|uniref:hypothetical protein n=1 Tax=Taibaiella koreensis TaxID=1268548 RepID=UPI0013C35751|nr:hypothetical protein [Taibaiella koreensis]
MACNPKYRVVGYPVVYPGAGEGQAPPPLPSIQLRRPSIYLSCTPMVAFELNGLWYRPGDIVQVSPFKGSERLSPPSFVSMMLQFDSSSVDFSGFHITGDVDISPMPYNPGDHSYPGVHLEVFFLELI